MNGQLATRLYFRLLGPTGAQGPATRYGPRPVRLRGRVDWLHKHSLHWLAGALLAAASAAPCWAASAGDACRCPLRCRPVAKGPGDFILRLSGTPTASLLAQVEQHASNLQRVGSGSTYRYTLTLAGQVEQDAVRALPGVAALEPLCAYSSQQAPGEAPLAWNLEAIAAPAGWQALGWPLVPLDARTVAVAVVDTGLADGHPDLAGRVAAERVNFTAFPPNADTSSDSSHGTAVGSIVAALIGNDDTVPYGIDGAMAGATIVPCKMAGSAFASHAALLACLAWLGELQQQGIRVVAANLSFGGPCCSCELDFEVQRLRERGMLLVVAAGNANQDNDAPQGCPWYPASLPRSNVIAVTGMDPYGNVMGRKGKRSVHIAAPGQRIPVLTTGGGKTVMPGGTSFAAPHATAVLAMLAAQDASRGWIALRNLLLAGGLPRPSLAPATITGRAVLAAGATGNGSLTCSGQRVRRRLEPSVDVVTAEPGTVLPVRALDVTCAASNGPLRVQVWQVRPSVQDAGTFTLDDQGQGADDWPGDGELAATWRVPSGHARTYQLVFWNDSSETLTVEVP